MAKLADALDLGSSGRPWGFKSLHPHQKNESPVTYRSFRYKTAIVRFMGVRFFIPHCAQVLMGTPFRLQNIDIAVFLSFCWSQNFIYGRLPTLAPLRTSAYGDPIYMEEHY